MPKSVFRPCTSDYTPDSKALNDLFCVTAGKTVVFSDTGLTCPAWSTFVSGGAAVLDVDAAFLAFTGCACPDGQYWGYTAAAADAALLREAAIMVANAALGANESALQTRRCLPCPEGLKCNTLAHPVAQHALVGSSYPLFDGAVGAYRERPRWALPYASRIVSCLHPEVCNREPADVISTWAAVAQATAAGVLSDPALANFQCRQGHDPASLGCSRCLAGYYANGFLCERCTASLTVLVPLLGVIATVATLGYLLHRAQSQRQLRRLIAASPRSTAERDSVTALEQQFAGRSVATVIWFLQVSAALEVSAQFNEAATSATNANAGDTESSWRRLSWLDQVLSFTPWAFECPLGVWWSFVTSSVFLLSLPWLTVALALSALVLPRMRQHAETLTTVAFMMLDFLYLPVGRRCIEWFNRDTSFSPGRVCGRCVFHQCSS